MAGQLIYGYNNRAPYLAGQVIDSGYYDKKSYLNPLLPQIGTLTFGGTIANGDYSITITPPEGVAPVTFTFTRTGAQADNNALAAAFNTAMNVYSPFLGIVSGANASAVNTLTFRRNGLVYTVTTSAPGGATLEWAQTRAAGGTAARVGMWARQPTAPTSDRILTPIVDGTVITDLVGIVERTLDMIQGTEYGLAYESIRPGERASIVNTARVGVYVFEAVHPKSTPFVWIDPAATAVPVGAMVKSSNGGGLGSSGDAIDVSSICRFDSVTPAGGIAVLEFFRGL